MFFYGDPTFAQVIEAEEPNMTNCERCGFPCNRDTDSVCPWCKKTKKEDGYAKLKIK